MKLPFRMEKAITKAILLRLYRLDQISVTTCGGIRIMGLRETLFMISRTMLVTVSCSLLICGSISSFVEAQDLTSAESAFDIVDLFNDSSLPQFASKADQGHGPPNFGDVEGAGSQVGMGRPKRQIFWRTLSSSGGQPSMLMVGDSIDLGDWGDYILLGDYKKPGSRPKNLTIIANEVRISKPVELFAIGGNDGPNGSSVTLITQRLVFEAPLSINTVGDYVNSGTGGNVTIVAASVEVKGAGRQLATIAGNDANSALRIANAGENGGAPGVTTMVQQATGLESLGRVRELSIWRVHWLEYLNYKIRDNFRRKSDFQSTADLISKYRDLPPWPVEDIFRSTMSGLLDQLDDYLQRIAVIGWPLTLRQESGIEKQVLVFFELGTLETRIAPTEALVIPQTVIGRTLLGTVSPINRGQVELGFNVVLTLDPQLAYLAEQKLGRTGQTVTGSFVDWTLSPAPFVTQGVIKSTIIPSGSTLQITLDLDPEVGTLALWRLGSPEGLPLLLNYECTGDHSIRGQFAIPLSLSRRTKSEITLNNGIVTNASDKDVSLQYFMLEGSPLILNPSLVVPSKDREQVALPLPTGTDSRTANIEVPPEAVVYTGRDPFSLEDFYSTLGEGLIQTVQVQNLLKTHSDSLNLDLDYVELTVIYIVGTGSGAVKSVAGPFRLSSSGSDDSSVTASFIRPNSGSFTFQVTGTAVYDKGRSRIPFRSEPSSDLTITVDQNLFSH